MAFIGRSFQKLDGWLNSFAIEALEPVVRGEWIDDALRDCGRETLRIRKLPARFVLWLLIAMSMYRTLSIVNVLQRIGSVLGVGSIWKDGVEPGSPAVVRARDRLGFGPLRAVLLRLQDWLLDTYREAMRWRGLLLLTIDGTTFKVADSDENRRRFGLPGSSRGRRAAFPQLRAVFLVSAKLRFVLRAVFAPFRRGELTLAARLLPEVPRGSLLLLDRLYLSWYFLRSVMQRESHFLVRVRKRVRPRRCRQLGPGDHLVEVRIPRGVLGLHPDMPRSLLLREITVRIRGRWYRYLTSLLDARAYPARDLVTQYGLRWEHEIALDEVKTHQSTATTVNRPLIFRCQRSRRVLQEAYALVIVYNAVRTLMTKAALEHGVKPLRISFVDSLERIRDAARLMAAAKTTDLRRIYDELHESIARCVLPPRPGRSNRREVCVKMSAYPKKWKKGA